jgi:hypothetical protein
MEWASCLFRVGEDSLIPWLTTDWVLSQFSEKLAVARRIYEKYIREEKEEGHQREYHQGSEMDSRILGDDLFIDRVLGPKRSVLKSKIGLEGICGCFVCFGCFGVGPSKIAEI